MAEEILEQGMNVKKGAMVTGTIVKIADNQAYVDVGYKFEGVLPARELSAVPVENIAEVLQVGQTVTCKVVAIQDDKELILLSKRLIDQEAAWETMQQYLQDNQTFEAKVAEIVKGGIVVDVGVRGFIPASMVERHFVEDFSNYKGRTLKLKVKELDRVKNKLILSHKDVLEEAAQALKTERIHALQADQIIEGVVQRLTPFGVFVDLGGIDGLVHISELSWQHVDQPADLVKEGDKVRVKILKIEPENGKISLSIKAATPGPWESVSNQFKIGVTVQGTVRRLTDFGAFIEIAPGIEGLVHVSQIAHRRIRTPHEVLKVGQTVSVKILDVNVKDKRVSLSIKETEDAPPPPVRQEREPKGQKSSIELPESQSLNFTLGERFGDKLSKFKP